MGWPETAWPAFEERLAKPASEQGYYVQEVETGEFLGHVHYEVDSEGAAHIGLNVIPGRRRNGLGQLFLRLLLERVWADTLAQVAVNNFEDDRLDVLRLHQRLRVHCRSDHDDRVRPTYSQVAPSPGGCSLASIFHRAASGG
ncbi:MAG: GNAT family N-acetyltransferase [Propionibacteriaceae bacterium]